jgi:hypothetical protein
MPPPFAPAAASGSTVGIDVKQPLVIDSSATAATAWRPNIPNPKTIALIVPSPITPLFVAVQTMLRVGAGV